MVYGQVVKKVVKKKIVTSSVFTGGIHSLKD